MMTDFTGRWFTTFGTMELTQQGDRVEGFYLLGDEPCPVTGQIASGRLTFTYREPTAEGEGWFELKRGSRFAGRWRSKGGKAWATWEGTRAFEGVWSSTFGPLRLRQDGDRVQGFYEGAGPSVLEGRIEAGRLTFQYTEPAARGEGQFTLAEDGQSFVGEWKPEAGAEWKPWVGRRMHPRPGLRWLVVLEAYWQVTLAEDEFSFGGMLREFFARSPSVEVRHRFFDDLPGLQRWLRQLLYLPEPVALVLAAHGNEDGLRSGREAIDTRGLIDVLRWADNVLMIHFSACRAMSGRAGEVARGLQEELRLPVSGYTTSVDWVGSALLEFHLLDMVLNRGLAPEDAARQLPALVGYTGDQVPTGSPYPAAGFRVWPAG